ncbi:DUF3243 domain-containing protein [Edaphobacillus lindanitolerans]|uniref:DUF3243 domain-containing protein n=1 Tax=Edaphobacillus lindanitolerans TaxID=550447 RepID=A0A1U7PMX5_9BACI|nr:DUF3243 domain-containing protein [Edaphobacillus lindanitolerans]SIT71083.1 Protein of unknown function [Edaphobacillus lindanitolerans]
MDDFKEKIENRMGDYDQEEKEQILENFNHFKQFLSEKVEKGEKMGLSEEQLAKGAELVANYLAKHEEPRNREQYLLAELWKAGNKDEQHHLAHMLVKLVQND